MNNRGILRCFATLLVVAMPLALFAQSGTVAGRVTDQDGNALAGANVLVVGTNLGAATGVDGDYSMSSVPAGDYKVSATYIGYATESQDVSVLAGSVTEINFALRPSAIDLNEVVVTGTGVAVEKSKVGNTVGTISMDNIANAPVNSVDQILTGREPGVMVNLNGGLAGEGAEIRIRGTSSLTQSNQPTIYVDGVRMDNSTNAGGYSWNGGVPGRMSEINPDAIERIEILKGATASALYGSKASNGIINIITKQGAIGKPKFSFKMAQTTGSYDESRYKETVRLKAEVIPGNPGKFSPSPLPACFTIKQAVTPCQRVLKGAFPAPRILQTSVTRLTTDRLTTMRHWVDCPLAMVMMPTTNSCPVLL